MFSVNKQININRNPVGPSKLQKFSFSYKNAERMGKSFTFPYLMHTDQALPSTGSEQSESMLLAGRMVAFSVERKDVKCLKYNHTYGNENC